MLAQYCNDDYLIIQVKNVKKCQSAWDTITKRNRGVKCKIEGCHTSSKLKESWCILITSKVNFMTNFNIEGYSIVIKWLTLINLNLYALWICCVLLLFGVSPVVYVGLFQIRCCLFLIGCYLNPRVTLSSSKEDVPLFLVGV